MCKIVKKARMTALTTSIQYCPGSPSQSSKTRKRNNKPVGRLDRKKENLFADNMM